MTEPPSIGLILPFAAIAGWHMLRAVRLRASTHGLIGGGTTTLVMLAYAPAALCMLNAETLTPLAPAIEWVREHVLALLVMAAILSEFALRYAVMLGAQRLAPIVETDEDPRSLAKTCDALQAIRCHDLAIVGLRRLATMDHDEAAVRTSLAGLYGIQRRFLQAEASAREAIALDPSNAVAHHYLAGSLLEQGRLEESANSRIQAEKLGVASASYPDSRKEDPSDAIASRKAP